MDEHFYHGRPCKRCGSTAKRSSRGDCFTCTANRRNIPKKETKFYHGKPCKHCGETLRYESTKQCVACIRARTAAKNAERPKPEPRYKADEKCLGCGQYKNYFFLDYCHDCRKVMRKGWDRYLPEGQQCASCGEFKHYAFIDYCRKCQANETRRREGADYFKHAYKQRKKDKEPY